MHQTIMAILSSDTVYTFSLTVDWFHTVHAMALAKMPANAAPSRGSRAGRMLRSQRSATRNQNPAPAALVNAANRLIRLA